MQEMQVQFLGREDPLEKEMATHSSIFTWEIPWTEEPDVLQSMELQRVRHYLTTKPTIIGSSSTESGKGNGTPLQYSCLENPMDRGTW